MRSILSFSALAVLLLGWLPPEASEAQSARGGRGASAPAIPARFFGVVVDASTLLPVPGARLASPS